MTELAEEASDQYLEEEFDSNSEEMMYKKLYRKMMNDFVLKKKGDNIKTGEEVDRMKFQRLIAEYKKFKRNHIHHFRFKSASHQTSFGYFQIIICHHLCIYIFNVSGEEIHSTLQLVQIYFDTATFDDIERDKKIKTEAQLSLIGGTMGLLTGFSIISGIEIIFFIFRLT